MTTCGSRCGRLKLSNYYKNVNLKKTLVRQSIKIFLNAQDSSVINYGVANLPGPVAIKWVRMLPGVDLRG